MALIDADDRNGARSNFAGSGEEGTVAAEHNDEVAIFAQLGFVYGFAVGGILDIDAVFFYAQFIQIDGEAVFAQKRNQCVDGILNFGRIGTCNDTDVFKWAFHDSRPSEIKCLIYPDIALEAIEAFV
ncbi:hypothetical protein NEISUBOT_04335 [Neisseria subflava NJ9703]|uniref:Uncharacterized protein n=1 Tax=Neisseria subflava NJ9703 TaxID=546268 RepID=A0A9W5IRE2_NEISU|nr:hypothetical protein NEISUBOT_04335 [Neisseria subflava NJ9703]